jgi:AcrR family transcriptional regulator
MASLPPSSADVDAPVGPVGPVEEPVRDGRDVRWEAHRTRRRRQLVEAALRAIRKHGAGVGMDEIAAEGATSKTVLYRHLGDRAGLYRAVVAAVDETILADLAEASAGGGDVVERIGQMVRSYLELVERDPEIYRFVVTRPLETPEGGAGDPVHRITDRIADQLTEALREHLDSTGSTEADALAPVWAHGLVGMVRTVSDHWLSRRATGAPHLDVDEVTGAVVALIRPALTSTPYPPA